MAFGKNPDDLNSTASFRQKGAMWNSQKNEKKQRKSVSGGAPTWVDEYRPSTDDVDTIRLIAGNYTIDDIDGRGEPIKIANLPWFPFVEHYHALNKHRSVCSAGPNGNDRNKKLPCHGCDLFWSSMKTDPASGKKVKGFMGKRDMSVFTVLDYRIYHKVEQVDRNGQVRKNDAGQVYYSWVKCGKNSEGRGGCDACDEGTETKQGHRLHWPMGSDHYNALLAFDENIGKGCTTCGGRATIRNEAWLCANPDCGEAVLDSQTRLPKGDIENIVNKPNKCRACGYEGLLIELINCSSCTPGGHTPRRANLFDVDLQIKRIEARDGTNRTSLSIVGWSDPSPVAKQYAELAKPKDLPKIFAPTPLEKQAYLFQIEVPREPTTAGARPYAPKTGGPSY